MMTQAEKLRGILSKPGILTLPGVYDCLGAKLAERAGFPVLFTSGFGISASNLGYPDFGLMTATEMLWAVQNIARSVAVPVVADIDTGYGNALNVVRTVEEVVKSGVAGIILEDQDLPKKCGHFEGKKVISAEEHVEKIRAARHAGADSGLVIVARTDARAELGIKEAIRRGRAYFEAGADVIFVEAPRSVEELKIIAEELEGVFLFANMVEGGKTPVLTAEELEALGYKIAVFPLSGLFAAARAMEGCFKYLMERGTTAGFEMMATFAEFEGIIDTAKHRDIEKRFSVKV